MRPETICGMRLHDLHEHLRGDSFDGTICGCRSLDPHERLKLLALIDQFGTQLVSLEVGPKFVDGLYDPDPGLPGRNGARPWLLSRSRSAVDPDGSPERP